MNRATRVLGAAVALGYAASLAGQTDNDEEASTPLEIVTVIGTRTERPLDDVAATVSVRTAEDIERELSRDIADLVRFEPGVTVAGTGSRFGLSGFNIRGIGGNRVLTLVDGVRVPEEFSFGPFLSARRDFVDVDSLERAEIARGPISSLYGSDALGGVVAFTTKSPSAYLDNGRSWYGGVKGGYSSADESTVGTLSFAAGNERLSGLLLYTRRDGNETENSGSTGGTGPARELPDPMSFDSDNIVAKLEYKPSEAHRISLGVDHFANDTDTQVLSDYGATVFGTTVNSRDAVDERTRTRLSLAYRFEGSLPFADSVQATVYTQGSDSEQLTLEARTTAAGEDQNRRRLSTFDQDIDGAFAQLNKTLEFSGSEHLITYGLDYYRTDNESLRDGGTFSASGDPVPEFFPFPTRDFPPTEVDQLALFIQDEITILDGRLSLSPGLRYDRFDAEATADDLYLNGNPGSPLPEDYDDSEVTAKLGAVYRFSENVSVYGRYSEGFRAPPYDDVNVGFSNFIGGYKTISNPDLESERSAGLELGVRLQGRLGAVSIAAFHNDYEDFIESLTIAPQFLPTGGIDPADGLLTFQSINREEVEIKGAELSGLLNLDRLVTGLSVRGAVAYADGEDQENGEPINSVEPLTGVLGLRYDAPSTRWGAEIVWSLVEGKDQSDIDANNPRLPTGGYGIVDLLAHLDVTDRIRINVGLFNVGDRSYIRWGDTVGIGADAPARFTQPGFNAGATVRVEL